MPNSPKLRSGPHKISELFDLNRYPELGAIWGIYVGDGCVSGVDPLAWKRIDAHAHALEDDEWRGWICVAQPRDVRTPKGRPTQVLWHELAHILARNGAHGTKWRDILIGLGCKKEAEKYYEPRQKRVIIEIPETVEGQNSEQAVSRFKSSDEDGQRALS